jgi:hypothetical protein
LLSRLISGGQTGVDRAALDVALKRGLPCGGWCPRGRRAEDGPIDARYPLQETPSDSYPQRTRWNVRDSDGTLILTRGQPDRGTALTIRLAAQRQTPLLVLDLSDDPEPAKAAAWVREQGVRVLNVAGPRESSASGIYCQAAAFLQRLLGQMSEGSA